MKIDLDGAEIDLHIHRADSDAVLIMYPGADGDIDGYNGKYRKIAELIRSRNIATVVRMDNRYCPVARLPYQESMIVRLAHVIEHIYDNAERIALRKEVGLYLAGVSAGASSVAAVLDDFPLVKKVLLVAPADSAGRENMERGLRNYRGELFLAAGEDDEIGALDTARFCHDISGFAMRKEIGIIPECGHQFRGEKNGRILANAYLWAFAGEGNFPSHEGGIALYE